MKKYYIRANNGWFFDSSTNEKYCVVFDTQTKQWSTFFTDANKNIILNFLVENFENFVSNGIWMEISEKEAYKKQGIIKEYKFDLLQAAFNRITIEQTNSCIEYAPKLCNESKMIYRYLRFHHEDGTVRGNGGITLGFIIDYNNQTLKVYPAICEDSDTFNKHYGISVAARRHGSNEYFTVSYDKDASLVDNILEGFYPIKVIGHIESLIDTLNKKLTDISLF